MTEEQKKRNPQERRDFDTLPDPEQTKKWRKTMTDQEQKMHSAATKCIINNDDLTENHEKNPTETNINIPKKANLFSALCRAQGEFQPIPKKIQGYGYKYASLEDVWKMLRKPLSKNGLCILQDVVTDEKGQHFIKTTLAHESGESRESQVKIPNPEATKKMNSTQAFGATITYMRRYALSSMMSLTADEDIDGVVDINLLNDLKEKTGKDALCMEKTRNILEKYGAKKMTELPKTAEREVRKLLAGGKNE